MLGRKCIYITPSIILIAGLAIIFVINRIALAPYSPYGSKTGAPLYKFKKGTASTKGSNFRVFNYLFPPNAGVDNEHTNFNFIMNQLDAFGEEESFGSYRLKGVFMYAKTPGLRRANIEDVKTGQTGIYSLDETLPDGSQLVDIKYNYITLEKNGVRKKIYLYTSEERRPDIVSEMGWYGYKTIGNNEFALKPYQIFQGDPNRILDFSIQASDKDGYMEGLKITNAKENVLIHTFGLLEGDVLLEVNKEPINSLYKCIKICFDSRNSDELQLKIRRGEKVISQIYHLYWEGSASWTVMDLLNTEAGSSLLSDKFVSHLF
jgi:hypothetical protein